MDASAVSWVGTAPQNEANPRSQFVGALHARFQTTCTERFFSSATRTPLSEPVEGSREEVLRAQIRWDREVVLGNYFLRYLGYELDRLARVSTTLPYLDEDVTAIADDVAPSVHMLDGAGKYLLRTMARKYALLTETQLAQRKKGFVFPPIGRDWVDYPLVRDRVNARSVADRGIFRPAAVTQLIETVKTGGAGVLEQMMVVSIWSTQVLAEQ